ncbi:hypothetical protein [Sporosarcina sp. Marseille-Q4943]|uniref:hypothetical protein n=1 Tax=Sporosarcina sp. Marseille-Q4943 TaxID=2942204 RepID=UPI00208DCB8C|nr:hypothetical protein [Sporosarcina sp. Marseille-Q4943]
MNIKVDAINLSSIMENAQDQLQDLLQAGCCTTGGCESPITMVEEEMEEATEEV